VAEPPANRPLDVALIDPSGYSRPYDHELARSLARRGNQVTLYTAAFVHGQPPAAEGYAVEELFYRCTNRLPGPGRVRQAAKAVEHVAGLAALRRRLLGRRPDVVHVQWSVLRPPERRFYRSLARAGLPVVFTAHDPVPNVGGAARRRSAAATARVFERVIVHTEWGRRALVERCGVDPGRIRLIPHGELAFLREQPVVDPPADAPGPTVVLPGLIRGYKGTDLMLAAWPAVRSRVPDAQLVIAGRPMLDLSRLPTGQPGVRVVARYVEDAELAAILRRADVVALPYRSIDSSGVVFAALALGAALVLSDVGGFRELHERHGVGELVPAGDVSALAAAVAAVLADPARRDRLRQASAAAAAGPFAWRAIAAATEDVYRELVPR
jgi:glycosyltransferase involved in cell wall biosynthesis